MDRLDQRPMTGGPLALDLLNTTWSMAGQTIDWLDSDDALRSFSAVWDHPTPSEQLIQLRAALIEAREISRRLFDASTEDGDIPSDLASDVNAVLGRASIALATTTGRATVSISSQDETQALAVEAIVSALDLLKDRPDRIRSCEHDQCVLWFLDTSKAGRRRWCSMDRCGNRAKAKRHYERSATPPTEAL